MKVPQEKSDRTLSSGDWLVNWFFWRFISILKSEDWRIQMKPNLRVDGAPQTQGGAFGVADFDDKVIYLNPSRRKHPTRDELGRTLVHELSHLLFNRSEEGRFVFVSHRNIYSFEKIWDRFSPNQKKMLLSFIPKKYLPPKD